MSWVDAEAIELNLSFILLNAEIERVIFIRSNANVQSEIVGEKPEGYETQIIVKLFNELKFFKKLFLVFTTRATKTAGKTFSE